MSLPSRLLLVTDRRQARRSLTEIVREACASGCRWISVREKDLPEHQQITLYRELKPIAHACSARMTIHGSAETAKAAVADGVHLASGSDVTAARALLGREALIGISIHNAAEAARLDSGAVDYVIAGPTHLTPSKPGYGPALGLTGIVAIVSASAVPVLAIGGIAPENASEVIQAGATGIAVMGSVMRSATPGREIADLIEVLEGRETVTAPR